MDYGKKANKSELMEVAIMNYAKDITQKSLENTVISEEKRDVIAKKITKESKDIINIVEQESDSNMDKSDEAIVLKVLQNLKTNARSKIIRILSAKTLNALEKGDLSV